MKSWYLVGPMTTCYYGTGKQWRIRAKHDLNCIDPYEEEKGVTVPKGYKDLFVYYNELRVTGQFNKLRKKFHPILNIDDDSVDMAFGLLCYEPKNVKISSWGTIREVVRAYERGKPIVVWTEVPIAELNFTMLTLSTVVVDTYEKAIETCKKLEAGKKVKDNIHGLH